MTLEGQARRQSAGAAGWPATLATPWAIVGGILPVARLVMFFIAIGAANASRVVPVSSTYPLVTVVTAWLLLKETITVTQAFGMLLVIGGVIVLTR